MFVDEQLAGRAPETFLIRADPDLFKMLLAWTKSLSTQWPRGSTRPGTFAANMRILLNQRQRHPDRDLAPQLAQIAAATIIASLHRDNQMLRNQHHPNGTLTPLPLFK
ncbi:hypothetical protein [Streptomyces sp. NBC_01518]|uniref:hypothetical protein n=1 Tax=Streptomyces sp. NBC_01518 TaxID=2903891 RepID=UPI00386D0E87